jgi:flavorubredoxin
MMETRIDHIAGGIYRISTMTEAYGITYNQFLIDDEAPTLIHTGEYGIYANVKKAIGEVLDPATLANVVLLHWEGDENGGHGPLSDRRTGCTTRRLRALDPAERRRLRRA